MYCRVQLNPLFFNGKQGPPLRSGVERTVATGRIEEGALLTWKKNNHHAKRPFIVHRDWIQVPVLVNRKIKRLAFSISQDLMESSRWKKFRYITAQFSQDIFHFFHEFEDFYNLSSSHHYGL